MWGAEDKARAALVTAALLEKMVVNIIVEKTRRQGILEEYAEVAVDPLPAHYQMRDATGKVVFDSRRPYRLNYRHGKGRTNPKFYDAKAHGR